MFSNPSPRARLLAVLALVLFAGGVAYLLISSSDKSSDTTTPPIDTTQTDTNGKTETKTTKTSPEKTPANEGLAALEVALVAKPVVVVSLYAPDISIDAAAKEEARAGAATAGAGFVAFNVYDEKQARQLARLLGADFQVMNPEVLFFKRPRSLAFELQGFADSQVVAQAAKNVYPVIEPWVFDANRVCRRYSSSLRPLQTKARAASLTTVKSREDAAEALEKAAALLGDEANDLSAIHAEAGKAAQFSELIAGLRQAAANMSSEANALRKNDSEARQAASEKNAALVESMGTLAAELQLSSCSV